MTPNLPRSGAGFCVKSCDAFSMIEVVLAVGVISFALVGIIGLFPVAMQSALDSQRETQVALIARSLFSEIQRPDYINAHVFVGKALSDSSIKAQQIPLAGTPTADPPKFYFDVNGQMVMPQGATPPIEAVYAAEVSTSTNNLAPGLSRVEVNMSVVATSPTRNYPFVTWVFSTPPPSPAPPKSP